MMMFLYALAGLLIGGGLLYHFAALGVFNLLVPKDSAARLAQAGVAYGPDPRHRLDIYAPVQNPGPWPVVLFVHGGSWSSGSKAPYGFLGRALAAQGFLTLVMSYRLHPQHPYPAFVDDTARALQWASANGKAYGGDGRHLFALGHSAGAYNLAQAILDPKYLAQFSASRPAISGVATLAGPFDFLPLDSPISISVFGKVENLADTQPINHARANAPPFLFLHGTADTTCRPANSINLDTALRAAGAVSQLKLYERVGHVAIMLGFAKPLRHLAPSLADVTAFFRSQLKD